MSAPSPAKALGIDIGGTNVRAAVIGADGTIFARRHQLTPYEDGILAPVERWIEAAAACALPLLADYPDCVGAGVGCGGQLDPTAGMMRGINTGDPRFIDYPIGTQLAAALGVPVCIDNDVKMTAYGEMYLGAGRGARHLLCVAVGTGIGGAVIVDGALYHGRGGLAGHLGQFPDPQTGVQLEAIAGGVPLGKNAVRDGILAAGQDTAALFAQARAGDSAAIAHIHHAAGALGRVLAGLAHTLEPERILLGGSVGIQPEYLDAANAALAEYLMPAWRDIRIHPAALGTDAGQIGAGLCAINRFS